MLRVIAVVLALSALPAFAFAEGGSTPDYCGQGQECTTYFFDNEVVDGNLQNPNGDIINSSRRMRQVPLIRTRSHFIREIVKSAENL